METGLGIHRIVKDPGRLPVLQGSSTIEMRALERGIYTLILFSEDTLILEIDHKNCYRNT